MLAVGVAITVGACGGGSSEADRSTPENAPTVVNSAPQTVDEEGFPVDTAPSGDGGGQTTTSGGGGEPTTGGGGGEPSGDPAAGKTAFESSGCGGCHVFSAAGSSGAVGPDLDKVLQGKDAAFIKESIIDPEAEIAAGYPPGVMPSNYEQTLQPKQIDDLVAFLSQG
jgi:mono/diheme cytochrome c family protein